MYGQAASGRLCSTKHSQLYKMQDFDCMAAFFFHVMTSSLFIITLIKNCQVDGLVLALANVNIMLNNFCAVQCVG